MTGFEFDMKYTIEEQETIASWFATWLSNYTDEVVTSVMAHRYEIIEDKMSMHLLQELHERTEKERKEDARDMWFWLTSYEDNERYLGNHCLTHASSYREVLYDMWIK